MGPKIQSLYQGVAVQGASMIAITILLYDRLVADITAAIDAVEKGDIERRCAYLNHAFLILQRLHSDLNMQDGGDTAKSLQTFYMYIHRMLLEAQAKQSAQVLRDQIELILQVRSAWYEVETNRTGAQEKEINAVAQPTQHSFGSHRSYGLDERPGSNWTA